MDQIYYDKSLKMDSRIIIKVADKSELDGIYTFHEGYYPNQRSKEAWEWEYGEKSMKDSVLVMAKCGDNIVATVGMMMVPINIGGKKLLSGKNESLLIDNDFRGQGLCTKIYNYGISKCGEKNMVCLWGFTRKAIGPLLKVNFVCHSNVMRWSLLPLSYRHTANQAKVSEVAGFKGLILKAIIKMASIYSLVFLKMKSSNNKKGTSPIIVCNQLKDNSDIIKLYDRLRVNYPDLIHLEIDEDFMKWRIKDSLNIVESFFIYQEEKLSGYLLITNKDQYLEITDLTFENDLAAKTLMNNLIMYINEKKIGVVLYSGNIRNKLNKRVFQKLKSYGFLIKKRPNEFVVRNIKFENNASFSNIENWYINDLWSEDL